MSTQTYSRFETKTRSAKPAVQTRNGQKPKQNYETSQAAQRRFTSEIKVDPRYMSALIGTEGCNIRRITAKVRNGLYIRGNGDRFTLTAYTVDALKEAAKIIKEDERALKNPTSVEAGTKPSAILAVDPETVSHIVGKGGNGLKQICDQVGDGCFIVHRENGFYITANNSKDLELAKEIINNQAEEFKRIPKVNGNVVFVNLDLDEEPKQTPSKPKKLVVEKPRSTQQPVSSRNLFSALEVDSDEEAPATPVKHKQSNNKATWVPSGTKKTVAQQVVEEFPSITLTIKPVAKPAVGNWGNSSKVTEIVNTVQSAKFTDSEKLVEQKRRDAEMARATQQQNSFRPAAVSQAQYVDLEMNEYSDEEEMEEVEPVVSHNINIAIVQPIVLPSAPAKKLSAITSTSWADMCEDSDLEDEEPEVYRKYEDSW